VGAALRVACFAVPPSAGVGVEADGETLVLDEWRRGVEAGVERAVGRPVEVAVGQGPTWAEAVADVDWGPAEVLAVGATSSAVSRFFLGSHAPKIVRSAPVPVTLVPGAAPSPSGWAAASAGRRAGSRGARRGGA
jgi:nucleotide-binding universal stress UspA family protein